MLSIDTNSDIDDYKESIIAGLNLKETLWAGLGVVSAAVAILILTMIIHIPLTLSIYIASPVAVPFILTGFFQKDGMSFWQRFRRRRNKKLSRPLSYVSTECKASYQVQCQAVKETDENAEFEHLLRRMKLAGIVFGICILVVIVLIVVFFIL